MLDSRHYLLGLGSNLGDRAATLDGAVGALADHDDIAVVSQSQWHESAPVGGPTGQGDFLNGAMVVETTLGPHALLEVTQRIENDFGRQRTAHWGPRTLDIDLLLVEDGTVVDTPEITIPHPFMSSRRFVLAPAVEVAGDWRHPQLQATLQQLLQRLDRDEAALGSDVD